MSKTMTASVFFIRLECDLLYQAIKLGFAGIGGCERTADDRAGGVCPRTGDFAGLLESKAALCPVQYDLLVGSGDVQQWVHGIRHVCRDREAEGDTGT